MAEHCGMKGMFAASVVHDTCPRRIYSPFQAANAHFPTTCYTTHPYFYKEQQSCILPTFSCTACIQTTYIQLQCCSQVRSRQAVRPRHENHCRLGTDSLHLHGHPASGMRFQWGISGTITWPNPVRLVQSVFCISYCSSSEQ